MFPDRINRLVVDGVVDANDYRETLWLDNLMDTEKSLQLFYYHCARVGYPKCALANSTGETTVEGAAVRVQEISASLYHKPLPVVSREGPDIVTFSDVKNVLLASLYVPLQLWPFIAQLLTQIEKGDVTWSWHDTREGFARGVSRAATLAIICSDGESQVGTSQDEFWQRVQRLEKYSSTLGELWASFRLNCIHYKVRPWHRFTNDWAGKTSHAILEIGNTADPVTPGRFAKKMAKGFDGAVVLIQDSPGHCSSAVPSNCTLSHVRQYFQTGDLPPKGTICPPDKLPFDEVGDEDEEILNVEMQKVKRWYTTLSEAIFIANGGFERNVLAHSLLIGEF